MLKAEREFSIGMSEGVPCYNARDVIGRSPVFYTMSADIIEKMLELEDLAVVDLDGEPLLWRCARDGIVNLRIAHSLRNQIGLRGLRGALPLEIGERLSHTRTFEALRTRTFQLW